MHKLVSSTAPSYLVEILSNAVNIDNHYKLQSHDNLDQFQFRNENIRNYYFQIV